MKPLVSQKHRPLLGCLEQSSDHKQEDLYFECYIGVFFIGHLFDHQVKNLDVILGMVLSLDSVFFDVI